MRLEHDASHLIASKSSVPTIHPDLPTCGFRFWSEFRLCVGELHTIKNVSLNSQMYISGSTRLTLVLLPLSSQIRVVPPK